MESTSELRAAAAKARRTAEHARRLANLMHQPPIKLDLMNQASKLEREAQELEHKVWVRERPIGRAVSRENLLHLISQTDDNKHLGLMTGAASSTGDASASG